MGRRMLAHQRAHRQTHRQLAPKHRPIRSNLKEYLIVEPTPTVNDPPRALRLQQRRTQARTPSLPGGLRPNFQKVGAAPHLDAGRRERKRASINGWLAYYGL